MIKILLSFIIICLIGYIIYLQRQKVETITVNQKIQILNEQIEEQIKQKKQELVDINNKIKEQNDIICSWIENTTRMRKDAEQQAQDAYEHKKAELEARLQEEKTSISAEIASIVSKKEEEILKLKEVKDKQLAYIKAQQRQKEIEQQQDYYRLVISDDDKSDISLLRDLQKHLIKKDSIDKIIYETYYKPAYDILVSHFFNGTEKVSGIYKLTNLTSGLAYIGQSVDIRERWRQHIKASLSFGQAVNKLYQSMQKDGQDNFSFEILEKVTKGKLNEREAYWIDFYKTKEYGLNSTRGNTGG